MSDKQTKYRFSFGPWNIHEGAHPFGPAVQDSFSFDEKLKLFLIISLTQLNNKIKCFRNGLKT